MKKRIATGALALSIIASGSAIFADKVVEVIPISDEISVEVNNKERVDLSNIDTYEKDGTVMIPLRKVVEGLMGLDVKWIQETQSVEVGSGPQWTSITIGKNAYFFARVAPFELSQAPEIKDGLTYVPIEFLTRVLRYEIKSDSEGPAHEEQILKGFIKDLDLTKDRKRVLVAGNESTAGVDEIYLTITEDTIVVDKDEKEFDVEDLKVGTKIQAVLPEIMALSMPPQGAAVKIIVENTDLFIEKIDYKDNEEINYPEIFGLEEVGEKVNEEIESFVKELEENEFFKDLKLAYEISLFSEEKLSIIFIGSYKLNEEDKNFVKSLNLDLETGNQINYANYFKEDEKSQEKLMELLNEASLKQTGREFEAEGREIYFRGSNVVVFYYELDDSVILPTTLYLPLLDVKDIVK